MKAKIEEKTQPRKIIWWIGLGVVIVMIVILMWLALSSRSRAEEAVRAAKEMTIAGLSEDAYEQLSARIKEEIYGYLEERIGSAMGQLGDEKEALSLIEEARIEELVNQYMAELNISKGNDVTKEQLDALYQSIISQISAEIDAKLKAQEGEIDKLLAGMGQQGGSSGTTIINPAVDVDLTSFLRVDRWDAENRALYITSISTEKDKEPEEDPDEEQGESDGEEEPDDTPEDDQAATSAEVEEGSDEENEPAQEETEDTTEGQEGEEGA